MMYFSKIFKVKEGKLDRFREWMVQLDTVRRKEAIGTFAYENVSREVVVLFKGSDENYYVVGLNEASDSYKEADSSVPINQEHRAIKKECLESFSEKGEVLLDLKI